jgi:hypothetical protein
MRKAGEEYPPSRQLGKPDARIGNASNLPVTASTRTLRPINMLKSRHPFARYRRENPP